MHEKMLKKDAFLFPVPEGGLSCISAHKNQSIPLKAKGFVNQACEEDWSYYVKHFPYIIFAQVGVDVLGNLIFLESQFIKSFKIPNNLFFPMGSPALGLPHSS